MYNGFPHLVVLLFLVNPPAYFKISWFMNFFFCKFKKNPVILLVFWNIPFCVFFLFFLFLFSPQFDCFANYRLPLYLFIFIRYFPCLHFQCYSKGPPYPPPAVSFSTLCIWTSTILFYMSGCDFSVPKFGDIFARKIPLCCLRILIISYGPLCCEPSHWALNLMNL